MRKVLMLFLIGMIMLPLTLDAGIYGTFKGKVVDDNGKALKSAKVLLPGAGKGALTNADGTFKIVGLNAGEFEVKVSYVGFQEYSARVKISADNITELTIAMSTKVFTGKTVDVVAIRKKDQEVGTIINMDNTKIQSVPGDGIESMVARSAGVVSSNDGGFNIRGGRSTQTQIKIDGVEVTNPFTGSMGIGGTGYAPITSSFAVEEVQVHTGGSGAEYGGVLGGTVNTVVKTGRNNRYDGFVLWKTDLPSLYGYQESGLELVREGNTIVPIDRGEGHQYQAQERTRVEFMISGPIPVLENSTFMLSAYNIYDKYRNAGYEIYDPWGSNMGQLPDNGTWKKNITSKFKFGITDQINLELQGQFGLTSFEVSSFRWLYNNDPGYINGVSNGIPERIAQQIAANQFFANGVAKLNHFLSSNSFYEIRFGYTLNSDEISERVGWSDPDFLTGLELHEPKDEYVVRNGKLVPGFDRVLDRYQVWTELQPSEDGYNPIQRPVRNALTGYYEGSSNSSSTNNPFGIQGAYYNHGNTSYINFRDGVTWSLSALYNLDVDFGDFNHNFKAGIDGKLYETHRHYNGSPANDIPFSDIYTDKWGGNIYEQDDLIKEITSKPFQPWKFDVWVQDQISYKGLIIVPGLRFSMFDPNSTYRLFTGKFESIDNEAAFADASTKINLAPSINVAYPITDKSSIKISYNVVYETPKLQFLYDGYNIAQLRPNSLLGNPNMEPQRVNQYDVNYDHRLTDDLSVSVRAYYKDIYNELGVRYFPILPTPWNEYEVSEYGNARGMEFELSKRRNNHFGFDLNYTYARVVGSANGATSNANPAIDPYSDQKMFPLSSYALSRDLRHRVNFIFTFFWGDNEGIDIFGVQPLENTDISISSIFRSGYPYTRTDADGKPISEINSERGPSAFFSDLRLVKKFKLSDFFGESAGKTILEFYVDVYNLFDLFQATGYYSSTGDPDDSGLFLTRSVGNYSPTPWYRDADYGKAESFSIMQYDVYGNRFYNEDADYDNNGVVTQDEKFQSFVDYAEMIFNFRGNYQLPRRVDLGILLRF